MSRRVLAALRQSRARQVPLRARCFSGTSPLQPLLDKCGAFGQISRGELHIRRDEVAAAHSLGQALDVKVVSSAALVELSRVLRFLSASGYACEQKVLEAAAKRCRADLSGDAAGADPDAVAVLALAACESGYERTLGVEFVTALTESGHTAKSDFGGVGASSLALSAAAAGCLDAPLLSFLLDRCSSCEADLDLAMLGDLRLASALVSHEVRSALDVRAASFLRTLCADAPLDDPRSAIKLAAEEPTLTPFEMELSQALTTAETPHSKDVPVMGMFVPIVSQTRTALVFAEDLESSAVYVNDPGRRTALQSWKYRALNALGWHVHPVPDSSWRQLVGLEQRAAHVRTLLQTPKQFSE